MGVLMDPKISFRSSAENAEYPDTAVSLHAYHPHLCHVFEKNRLRVGRQLHQGTYGPLLDHQGVLDKNNIPHIREL